METQAVQAKKELAITLHRKAGPITHPVLDTWWCLSKAQHAEIVEGIKKGYSYRLLIVGQYSDDIQGRDEFRVIADPMSLFRLTEFPRPGKCTLAALLFRSRGEITYGSDPDVVFERQLKSDLLDRRDYGNRSYRTSFPDLAGLSEANLRDRLGRMEYVPIAAASLSVDLPQNIFAPKPPEWFTKYLSYFVKSPLKDECSVVRRVPLAIIQLPFWLLIEGGKRLWFILAGIALALFARDGWKKRFERAFTPAVSLSIDRFYGMTDKEPLLRGWKALFTPVFLIVFAIVVAAVAASWAFLAAHLAALGLVAAMLIIAAIGAWALSWYAEGAEKRAARKRAAKLAERAALAERYRSVIVCEDEHHELELEDVPLELRSGWLGWLSYKRDHCRPLA